MPPIPFISHANQIYLSFLKLHFNRQYFTFSIKNKGYILMRKKRLGVGKILDSEITQQELQLRLSYLTHFYQYFSSAVVFVFIFKQLFASAHSVLLIFLTFPFLGNILQSPISIFLYQIILPYNKIQYFFNIRLQMERESDILQYQINFEQSYIKESTIKQDSNFKSFEEDSELNIQENLAERRSKKNLEVDEISTLYDKKANLENFIEEIGEYSIQPIRQDISDHCEKISGSIPVNLNKFVIMRLVKNRVDKMIKNKRIKKNWSEQDINILIWVISKYCQFHGISNIKDEITEADWINIARLIPGVTGKSCMFKWLSLKKSNLAENSWVEQESLLLDEIVKKQGDENWCRISQELYLSNPLPNKIYRCPKQCREHWNCYLNPKLKKGPWERKQDYLLLRAVKELQGVKKWAQIVKMFNGRTENALKNRFTLIIEKQLKEIKGKKKNLNQLQLVQQYLKKHENQYYIDDEKLKFLSNKRELINQNQLKRKPKRVCPKKVRQEIVYSEEEEYIPEQIIWRDKKTLRQKPKVREFQREIEQRDQLINMRSQMRSQIFQRQESFNRMASASLKKEDPIFEEDQQMNQLKQQGIKQQEKAESFSLPFNQMRVQCWPSDEHTNEQNMNIQSNGVKIVPFSNQFIKNLGNRTLIPCKMTGNHEIFSIRMQKK